MDSSTTKSPATMSRSLENFFRIAGPLEKSREGKVGFFTLIPYGLISTSWLGQYPPPRVYSSFSSSSTHAELFGHGPYGPGCPRPFWRSGPAPHHSDCRRRHSFSLGR